MSATLRVCPGLYKRRRTGARAYTHKRVALLMAIFRLALSRETMGQCVRVALRVTSVRPVYKVQASEPQVSTSLVYQVGAKLGGTSVCNISLLRSSERLRLLGARLTCQAIPGPEKSLAPGLNTSVRRGFRALSRLYIYTPPKAILFFPTRLAIAEPRRRSCQGDLGRLSYRMHQASREFSLYPATWWLGIEKPLYTHTDTHTHPYRMYIYIYLSIYIFGRTHVM